jgi:hypothetical protein
VIAELDHRARQHFKALRREEVAAAIRRMAREGFSDYCIVSATQLSVEAVRQILAESDAPSKR